jgi:Fic family protein
MKRRTGIYEKLSTLDYFIPDPLPPVHPSLALEGELLDLYSAALYQLAQLNEVTNRLPDRSRFLKAYIIKEAMFSSEIEGIHTTLLELFTQLVTETRLSKATQLVLNYTKALDKGWSLWLNSFHCPIVFY